MIARFNKYPWTIGVKDLPLFITFPRSGTHWVQACMEIAFDGVYLPLLGERPTLVSIEPLEIKWIDYTNANINTDCKVKWYFSHDLHFEIDTSSSLGSIYLFRNPIDSIFSDYIAVLNSKQQQNIEEMALLFKAHFERWVVNKKARTIITYEQMQQNPVNTLNVLANHLEVPFDKKKARLSIKALNKERMLKTSIKPNFTKEMLTEEYKEKRKWFHKTWGKKLFNLIVDKTNRASLQTYVPNLFIYE